MNRHILRISLLALAALLILVGCGNKDSGSSSALPSDPVAALHEINKTTQAMQSAHISMDMTMDMDTQGFKVKIELDAQGEIEMKGFTPQDANMRLEMNMSMLGQEVKMEMVALNGEYWMREGAGSWQNVPAEQANLAGSLGSDPTSALRYLENAKNVKKLKDEKVDGVDCYHFGFTMDADALGTAEMVGQLTGGGQLTEDQANKILETAVLEGEVWAAKTDLLPRRQTMHMTFDISGLPGLGDTPVKYDMQVEIKYTQINEPVTIQAPTS